MTSGVGKIPRAVFSSVCMCVCVLSMCESTFPEVNKVCLTGLRSVMYRVGFYLCVMSVTLYTQQTMMITGNYAPDYMYSSLCNPFFRC